MIDPALIREKIDDLRNILIKRNMKDAVDLDLLKKIDEERREITLKSDKLREKRNSLSKETGKLKGAGKDADELMGEAQIDLSCGMFGGNRRIDQLAQ